ncbi:hypothetical protein VTH06DRAFT_7465 [Thermothelomyces fergusii]
MRFSILWTAALAIAGLAARSCAQEMPTCATNCLVKYLPNSACDPTDVDCICADKELMDQVGTCVLGACNVFDGLVAKNVTATMCKEPVRNRSLVAPLGATITGGLALICVILRVYESGIRKKEFQWADLWAVISMICSIPMDACEWFMRAHGMGRDIWTLTPDEITEVVKYTWLSQIFYIPAIILTKVTVLCFFIHVFPSKKFHMFCWITIVHCVLFMVSTVIATILACIPAEYIWSVWTGSGEGVCFDNNAFWWAHSAINIATDLWVLALPIPQLLRLQMSTKKKIYLLMMFSVGIVITIISIIRFSGLLIYSTSMNPTFNNVNIATYSVIECNMSIVCCCMPALLSFLRHVLPSVFGSANHSDYKAGSYRLRGDGPGPGPGGSGGFGGSGRGKRGIQKTVTHTISFLTQTQANDDAVELIDVEKNKQDDHHENRS